MLEFGSGTFENQVLFPFLYLIKCIERGGIISKRETILYRIIVLLLIIILKLLFK